MATKLEQFDKWFCSGVYDYQVCDYPEREAWKAALEWALSHKKPIKYNDYKFDYIKTDVIEAELTSYADNVKEGEKQR